MPKGQQRGNREAKKPKKDVSRSVQPLQPQAPSPNVPSSVSPRKKLNEH